MTVEVEIRQYGVTAVDTQVMEFPKVKSAQEVLASMAQLAQICRWKEYRVGMGRLWTGWIKA